MKEKIIRIIMNPIFMILFILLMSILLIVPLRERKAEFIFLQDVSEIDKIEVVWFEKYDWTNETLDMELQYVIDDKEEFLMKFLQMDCYETLTGPIGIADGVMVFKITYKNGEYELINFTGRAEYTNEYQFTNDVGRRGFEQEQFEQLLLFYLKKARGKA